MDKHSMISNWNYFKLPNGAIVEIDHVADGYIYYVAVVEPQGNVLIGHPPYSHVYSTTTEMKPASSEEIEQFEDAVKKAGGKDIEPIDFKFSIYGDWFGGNLTISDVSLAGASLQLSSMFDKCHGQINIEEPKEYAHMIWNDDIKVFMTSTEYALYKNERSRLVKQYTNRNAMYAPSFEKQLENL